MSTRAADVAPAPQWRHDPFGVSAKNWTAIFRVRRSTLGFATAGALIAFGWLTHDRQWFDPERGIGYGLGIVSVLCMLILLLYPLRKRFRILKFIGPLPKWFRNHMILGVSAPIAALYHCNFQLGSLNSRIALFSALTVASSGLVGRFIYSKVHHGLYGRKASLKELLAQVKLTTPGVGTLGTFIPELMNRLTQFDRSVLVPPKSIFDCIRLPFSLAIATRLQYRRLARFTRVSLKYCAQSSPVVEQHRAQLERVVCAYVRDHLRNVRRVAEFVAYDRLLALWHKVHVPFFVVLVLTVTVHVFVVHWY